MTFEKRFQKHFIIPEIGEEKQKLISKSSALVIGAGGLGSSAIIHLVANGIGKIGIVDYDIVDISNIHRQIIYFVDDVGEAKISSVCEKIKKINHDVSIETFTTRVTEKNGKDILKDFDFVIEATDNIASKLLINDLCVKLGKPFSYAGVNKFFGSTITVIPQKTACLRCIFRNIREQHNMSGVFGPVPGLLGTIQAAEGLKFLGGFGDLLVNKMLFIDIYNINFKIVEVKKNNNCICNCL